MNENLSVVPCLSVRVGGIDRGADCLLLSSVWGGVLAIYDDRPFVIVECDDMLPDAVASTTGLGGSRAGLLQYTFV